MNRRHKLPPDNRLDWRDPNMPVLRYGKFHNTDGSLFIGTKEVPSNHIQQYYAIKLNNVMYCPPTWKDDPSYWWNRKARKRK